MTEKLYLKDSYQTSCKATVIDIAYEGDCISIAVDKTPLFPGGGGQPSDKGVLFTDSDIEITIAEAYEKDGLVYHRLADKGAAVQIGDTVALNVYSDLRFERMRAHTGEHIISGVAHQMYGVNNVGFHMDADCLMTVDFDKYLDDFALSDIENQANGYVLANKLINVISYPSANDCNFDYRSKKEFEGDVRIVEIEDVDRCACCAPHLKSTAEVGFIKILSSASHRGGVRITLICGRNSLREYQKRYKQILDISAILCSKYDEAVNAVSALVESNKALKYEKEKQREEFLRLIASNIWHSDIITEFFENLTIDDLRIINNTLADNCKYISLLFSGNDTDGYSYCVYSDKLQLKKFAFTFNASLAGSGGGRGTMIQGKVSASKSDILKFVNEMKVEDYENA